MKESKKIEIEKRLRELIRQAERQPWKEGMTPGIKNSGVQVIRRRKGAPDLRIA
ncbi:MAG: hypothetical protein LJE65_00870 [Desulfobacteraceae bacterium]|jgi:hypothetical protein|nr:hypothetical protein [Desulfobacteraceae bacterium]